MKNYFHISALLLVAVALTGCTVAGTYLFSSPALDAKTDIVQLDSEGIFHIGELEFSIQPNTSKITFLTAGPVLPIIPSGSGSQIPDPATKPFKITIMFVSNTGNYDFVPQKIILHYKNKVVPPTSFNGPRPKKYEITQPFDRLMPGHKWSCGWIENIQLDWDSKTDTTARLSGSTCFVLEYPILGISAEGSFSISFEGLQRNREPVHLPSIHFHPATKSDMGFTSFSF